MHKINGLITQNNMYKLQQMLQHSIENAMYALHFGYHNKQGIHGACPMEMSHAILLGLFRYTGDCFFQQIGEPQRQLRQLTGIQSSMENFY